MLTLYDDVFSPYARKVRIALYEKGVAFERVRALHGDCNRTDFLHVNPRAEVPALVEMGRGEAHAAIHEATGRDLLRLYDELERRAREPFFCGDFSVADTALAPHLMAA